MMQEGDHKGFDPLYRLLAAVTLAAHAHINIYIYHDKYYK